MKEPFMKTGYVRFASERTGEARKSLQNDWRLQPKKREERIIKATLANVQSRDCTQREIKPGIVREQKCEFPSAVTETSRELSNAQMH
jgi:hypothetical protein